MGPVVINHPNIPAGDANTDTLLVFYGTSRRPRRRSDRGAAGDVPLHAGRLRAAGARRVCRRRPRGRQPRPAQPLRAVYGHGDGGGGSTVSVATGMPVRPVAPCSTSARRRSSGLRGAHGKLTVCDYMVNNCGAFNARHWVPLASNVVSLRAEYGRDTTTATMDGTVDAFDQTAPTTHACHGCACGRRGSCWSRAALNSRTDEPRDVDADHLGGQHAHLVRQRAPRSICRATRPGNTTATRLSKRWRPCGTWHGWECRPGC